MICFINLLLLAQDHHLLFRSDKVWTVLAVMLVIWLSVLFLLIRLDHRLSCLEKRLGDHS
jgi:hypothetical protein